MKVTLDSNYVTLCPSYRLKKEQGFGSSYNLKKLQALDKAPYIKPKILVRGLGYKVRRC